MSSSPPPKPILGSSAFGAQLAAELGLPYAFASHFVPDQLLPALSVYGRRCKPSAQLAQPYTMIGVNIIAAENDREAHRLATTQKLLFGDHLRGAWTISRPPIDDRLGRLRSYGTIAILRIDCCEGMIMGGRMQEEVSVITGGASGIGAAPARLFVSEGGSVVIADLRTELGEALVRELGRALHSHRCDEGLRLAGVWRYQRE